VHECAILAKDEVRRISQWTMSISSLKITIRRRNGRKGSETVNVQLHSCPRVRDGELKKPCTRCWARYATKKNSKTQYCFAWPALQVNYTNVRKKHPKNNMFSFDFICVLEKRK